MNRLLPASLYLFIASAFALPTEASFSLIFYVLVMPLAALILIPTPINLGWWQNPSPAKWEREGARGQASARGGSRDRGLWLAMALIVWSGLSLLWGEDDGGRSPRFLLATAATAAFVLALSMVLKQPGECRRLATVLLCAGTANAACVLLLNGPKLLNGDRILGWGMTRQPVLGGSVMAVACLTALSQCLPGRGKASVRLLYGSASVLMAGFVIAMQSRGALLGLAGGVAFIASAQLRLRTLCATAAIAALLVLALPSGPKQLLLRLLLQRGASHRPEIWAQTLPLIHARPLFGHGLAANLPVSPTGFPHSLYLSLLFYSGAIGLLLFLSLGAVVTARILRAAAPDRIWVAGLWVNALLAGLTDFGQITKGPGPLWIILWLPILLALTLPGQATRSSPGPSFSNQETASCRCGESESASAQKAGP